MFLALTDHDNHCLVKTVQNTKGIGIISFALAVN